VPFLRARSAENRLQAVAKPAENRPVRSPDRLRHGLDRGLEPADRFLRIEAGDHFGGADDIGEQHGGLLAFAMRLDDGQGCGPGSATPAAKTRCRMATASARGADGVKRDAAVRAELAARRVIRRAIGALHGKLAAYRISNANVAGMLLVGKRALVDSCGSLFYR